MAVGRTGYVQTTVNDIFKCNIFQTLTQIIADFLIRTIFKELMIFRIVTGVIPVDNDKRSLVTLPREFQTFRGITLHVSLSVSMAIGPMRILWLN